MRRSIVVISALASLPLGILVGERCRSKSPLSDLMTPLFAPGSFCPPSEWERGLVFAICLFVFQVLVVWPIVNTLCYKAALKSIEEIYGKDAKNTFFWAMLDFFRIK